MKQEFKTIYVWFMCWFYPTNLLLKKTNHSNFTSRQMWIIGGAMLRRFATQEDLEVRCEKVFGETF